LDLVGAVGIELKAMLKARKLLISLNGKNAKNTGFAKRMYTPNTRRQTRVARQSACTAVQTKLAPVTFGMMGADPRWLEILKASGWQTTALTAAALTLYLNATKRFPTRVAPSM
jgi:hypothetical protein